MYLNLVQGSVKFLLIRSFFLCVYLEQCLLGKRWAKVIVDPNPQATTKLFQDICGEQYKYLLAFIEHDLLIISHFLLGARQVKWVQVQKLLDLRGQAFRLTFGKIFRAVAKKKFGAFAT